MVKLRNIYTSTIMIFGIKYAKHTVAKFLENKYCLLGDCDCWFEWY